MDSYEPVVCNNPSCSASLANSPVAGECPHCGRRYNKSTGMNTATAHCAKRGCGYNLASLPKWGQCPECGSNYNRLTGENVTRPLNTQEKHHKWIWRSVCVGSAFLAVCFLMCTGLLTWGGAWVTAKTIVSCTMFSFFFCALLAVYAKLNEKLE